MVHQEPARHELSWWELTLLADQKKWPPTSEKGGFISAGQQIRGRVETKRLVKAFLPLLDLGTGKPSTTDYWSKRVLALHPVRHPARKYPQTRKDATPVRREGFGEV